MNLIKTLLLCFIAVTFSKEVMARTKINCDSADAQRIYLENIIQKIIARDLNYTGHDQILSRIKRCDSAEFYKKLNQNQCLTNLKKFSESMRYEQRPGHAYGFLISDEEYFSDPDRAKYLELPKIFKNGLPDNWRALVEKENRNGANWEFVRFRSRLVQNMPNVSYDRLTFMRQTETYDQWIQFTLQGFDVMERQLPGAFAYIDLITMVKKDKNGQKLKVPKILFKEFQRDIKGEQPVLKKASVSCYSCHPNGPRPIRPDPSSVDSQEMETLERWNKIMSSYGGIDFDGAIDVKAHGPAYGKNGGQFSCTKCHNGFESANQQTNSDSWHFWGREVLNYRTNPTHIKARMVEMLEMPTYVNELPFMKTYLSALEAAKKDDIQDRIKSRSLTGVSYQLQEAFSTGIESYLYNIKEEGAITDQIFHQAMFEVKDMKSIMKRVHHEMDKAYNRELRSWLLGLSNANCLNLIENQAKE